MPGEDDGDITLKTLVYDEKAERLKIEAEIRLLKSMRIGDRAAVTFTSEVDDRGRMIQCEPYPVLGEIVALELHKGRGHVTLAFDGQDVPVGPFSPLEVRLIAPPAAGD